MDFLDNDAKALEIGLFYADMLNHPLAGEVMRGERDVTSLDEALSVSRFFWQMVDQSLLDTNQELDTDEESSFQFWMERMITIFSTYLEEQGYGEAWDQVLDEI